MSDGKETNSKNKPKGSAGAICAAIYFEGYYEADPIIHSRVVKKNLDLFKGCSSLKSITLRDTAHECASVPVPGEGH